MKNNKNNDDVKIFDTLLKLEDNFDCFVSVSFEIDEQLDVIKKYYRDVLANILKANGETVDVFTYARLSENHHACLEVHCSFNKEISTNSIYAITEYFVKNIKSGFDDWFFIDVYPDRAHIEICLYELPEDI